MKKWGLFSMFILMALVSYKDMPALAQQDEEISAIKSVMENYLTAFTNKDLNSMMDKVSANFSDVDKDGSTIDYARVKALTEYWLRDLSKGYADVTYSDLEIVASDLQDNKANIEIEFIKKGFNLDSLQEQSVKHKRTVSLTKEDGGGKITKYRISE